MLLTKLFTYVLFLMFMVDAGVVQMDKAVIIGVLLPVVDLFIGKWIGS